MVLENVYGNLLAYKELKSGTFQHIDQFTAEGREYRRLRESSGGFFTADGELYAIQRKHLWSITRESLWAITREPQNPLLQNIDEVSKQVTSDGHYFPDAEVAQASFGHSDTVVVSIKGLELIVDNHNNKFGYFTINPRVTKRLNSQQRTVAQRIFGPDEDNFRENMEMFADIRINPSVFVLISDYVQSVLEKNEKKFFAQPSCIYHLGDSSFEFCAFGYGYFYPNGKLLLRGRKKIS